MLQELQQPGGNGHFDISPERTRLVIDEAKTAQSVIPAENIDRTAADAHPKTGFMGGYLIRGGFDLADQIALEYIKFNGFFAHGSLF